MSEYFRKPIVKTLMLKGQEGQSIKRIEKTSTDGFVDTYTITLTDGATSTFTVTNGREISDISKTGTSGLVDTYTINFNDGTMSTFTVTNGDDNAYKPAVEALGKRIDNLILSSGTESSAEVVDARTGYDGKAHDTLGTAIRSQVSDLKSDLVNQNNALQNETNRAINRENEIEELFTKPTKEAVNSWLDAHPEATTTVQDNSLTIDKMVVGTLGYVTPEMFGAVGDGVTDDTEAIKQALDSGKTVVFNTNTVYLVTERLFLYKKNGVSLIGNNSTLKVSENVKDIEVSNIDATLLKLYECRNINVMGLNINGSKDFIYRTDDTSAEYIENSERYLQYRSKGFGGIGVEKCNRCVIQNCFITNTTAGIVIKNSSECVVELCKVTYTSADAYDVWYGSKNITVRNCRCEQNGDDAFAVYSLLKYWTDPQYVSEEIEVDQCENILFEDCYSLENRARFFINEGGKNVTIDNCIGVNCQCISSFKTDSRLHNTQNTIIRNCNILSKKHSGITNNDLLFIYNGNDVKIENCVFSEPKNSSRTISVYGTSNIDILNCKIKNINFSHHVNKESTDCINIEDCYFEKDVNYFNFENVKNLYLKNSTFVAEGDIAIYADKVNNSIINNLNLNTKKINGSINNIIIDDVKILNENLINSAASLKYSSIPYLNKAITSKNVLENSIQFVEGMPYYFKNGSWVKPFKTVYAIGSDYDCNNLIGSENRQTTYCINGAQNMPTNAIGLLVVNAYSNLINQTFYCGAGVYNRFYNGNSWESWHNLTNNN